jgi:dTDP-4-amino-4,6-dideoxygalactose transaminase
LKKEEIIILNINMKIPFNKPYFTGKETKYIQKAVEKGHISGNGYYTKLCQDFFNKQYDFHNCLLTTSCTDALEMSAILLNLKPEDEVIIPSYTFVSTALAFDREGAKIVFADSNDDNPNIDIDKIEQLITPNTKAIVVVHYAGVSVDMDKLLSIVKKHKLFLIEDAAQAIDSTFNGKPLGSFGDLSTFSFHETKNIISGEGGLLVINNDDFVARAEMLWEKGTNRAAFFRGEIDKYGWVDTGSSFLPSDIIAAFLFAQLENLTDIQLKRKQLWNTYYDALLELENNNFIKLPNLPSSSSNNAHMFYLVCNSGSERGELIKDLKSKDILSVFHYQSLHASTYYKDKYKGAELINSDKYSERLLRLPMYYELSDVQQELIISSIKDFFVK